MYMSLFSSRRYVGRDVHEFSLAADGTSATMVLLGHRIDAANSFLETAQYQNKKTPPLAAKRNGGAGTEKRPMVLMIPSFAVLSIVHPPIFFTPISYGFGLTRYREKVIPN